jgi:hypothetical protein
VGEAESRILTLSDRHAVCGARVKRDFSTFEGFQYQGKSPVVSSESSGGDTSKSSTAGGNRLMDGWQNLACFDGSRQEGGARSCSARHVRVEPASDRILSSIWLISTILHVIDRSAFRCPTEGMEQRRRGKASHYLWRFISGPLVAHEADRDAHVDGKPSNPGQADGWSPRSEVQQEVNSQSSDRRWHKASCQPAAVGFRVPMFALLVISISRVQSTACL